MVMGHALTRRVSGQPDDVAVRVAHITRVLQGALLGLAGAQLAAPVGAGEIAERLIGTRRTEGAR
ncbi:hypothetical protein [Streptomyces sp. NPDC059063]|uniref:hypothetical protein n=1 Tax=unclassified Streptomyces TaxID=2593676 RepID=UPI00369747F3